jgi:hypothetical protein
MEYKQANTKEELRSEANWPHDVADFLELNKNDYELPELLKRAIVFCGHTDYLDDFSANLHNTKYDLHCDLEKIVGNVIYEPSKIDEIILSIRKGSNLPKGWPQ